MSYLDQLKKRLHSPSIVSVGSDPQGMGEASCAPCVGSVGAAPGAPDSELRAENAFVGFVGSEGRCVSAQTGQRVRASTLKYLERLQTRVYSQVCGQNKSLAGRVSCPETYPLQAPTEPTKAVQQELTRCLVCDQRFAPDDAFVAVLSGTPDQPFWLHHRCHDEHIRRCLEARDRSPFLSLDARNERF